MDCKACRSSEAERMIGRGLNVSVNLVHNGTDPIVYFFAKKVEEMFGGFKYFLYLCIVIKRERKARVHGLLDMREAVARCSSPQRVSNTIKNITNYYGKK